MLTTVMELKAIAAAGHEVQSHGYGHRSNFELDEAAVRAKIWELTDQAYKNALDLYAKAKMNKSVTAEEEDKSGDFSNNFENLF